MEQHLLWLRQGDVFSAVPSVLVAANEQSLVADVDTAPGLLITEGSQLDKRTRAGRSSVLLLQFLPLRPVSELDPNVQHQLRKLDVIDPPIAVYVGTAPSGIGGELFGYLAEAYPIPPIYFGLEMRNYGGSLFADPSDPHHAVPTRNDTRVGCLSEVQVQILHRKMFAYWAKVRQRPPE